MPSLDEIRSALERHEPTEIKPVERRQAGVAMLLRQLEGRPQVLFIERAERRGDPWSGHMAFPGGRIERRDPHIRGAAERETREEVGISLEGAELLGRLDDMQGHRASGHPNLVISAFVYHLPDPPDLTLNHEVREAFWFGLGDLRDPARHVDFPRRSIRGMRFPGILVGHPDRHVVWGLTYRFLDHFFDVVGHPLPGR
jgi:8-oxo-dGTP pyrophosphatase MutT (NUDIX family)